MKYHKFNFFRYTYCEFESKEITFFEGKSAHYQSKSGSLYFYTDKGVFRYSNHWGRVANCRWKIQGIEHYKSQDYYVGFANWNDFYPLNNTDKVFYLEVDYPEKQAKIQRLKKEETNNCFLMTSEFAHQRLKQIQILFKEYKWATYFEQDIDVLREIIIDKLSTTNKTIQELKQELK
ncbi:cell division protein FtsQ [Tenacibaculum piscium]|uniref:Uncharacterized protein n=1 Tax=Tenacibaculum piscium TaxID=1458515 RepID=A0A2H1YEW6_9FLAO|nr:cell division protein FtsQ [Tenacibaculum piscium]MBE7628876.1 cell division protein FtsQ [Tenacibaculum piscium]MBE7671179.1 cell division protein FtsQ [Tenacibaculum piscium]MBE7685103.1 cell division protein FtsQ [Tenacibaculum piscium]MBE7689806.1 cell division protein FtsQ [Tenacibaculum piscium]MCG8183666.1 cell division protein FtsQ [Tenacibaculum piscium]